MALATVQDVFKSYDGQAVLDGVTLELHKAERVGLVGANGCGKTTLFKLIHGTESPDTGTVARARGLRIGYLPQEPALPGDAALIDAVREVFAEHLGLEDELGSLSERIAEAHGSAAEAALLEQYDRLHSRFEAGGGYGCEVRIREVLGGLGFIPDQYRQPVGILSGGQKSRAALARLLLAESDLLLLDEPTNHLDIDATRWLEKYLAGYRGGVVIISHDRYLLDRVVTKIIEIERRRVTVYPTNYKDYAETKRIRGLQAVREHKKQAAWVTHQKDYIDRARYGKDTAKQARGRQKQLDRMKADGEILDKPVGPAARMPLRFEQQRRGGDMVVRCEGAAKGYDGVTLIRDLDFEMTVGERVGIIGPNGVGKTTLLRMLMRQVEPDAGTVRLYENLTVGYYDQEHRDLDPEQTVIESVRSVRPEVREAGARSFLALFLFRGDEVFKRVGDLSGGEQSRVLLARLVWTGSQVLVLDEPTNHLDIPAREALEEALRMFPGSMLIVSHDRFFLDRVVDRLLVLPERGRHELIEGSWSKYAEILAEREQTARKRQARTPVAGQVGSSRSGRAKRKSRSKYAARRIEALETRIIAGEHRLSELEDAFARPERMRDPEGAKRLHDEYKSLKDELTELNADWERAVDELPD